MFSRSLLHTETFSTMRVPPPSGVLESDPVMVLSGVPCLPLYPADLNMRLTQNVDPSDTLLVTITHGNYDVDRGDTLIVGSGYYDVKSVGIWKYNTDQQFLEILVTTRI